MNQEHPVLVLELRLAAQPFGYGVGILGVFGHDKEKRLFSHHRVILHMLPPAFHGNGDPLIVGVAGFFVGILVRVNLVSLMDDQWCLDNAVFHCLGQRVVHHDPGEVGAVLVLWSGGKVEPQGQARLAFGLEVFVQRRQGLVPGQVFIVDMVRLVVEHHQVVQLLDPVEHGLAGVHVPFRYIPQKRRDRIDRRGGAAIVFIDLLDIGEEQVAACRGGTRVTAHEGLQAAEVVLPFGWNDGESIEDGTGIKILPQPLVDDDVRGDNEEVGGKVASRLEAAMKPAPGDDQGHNHGLAATGGHLHRIAG